jgi:hypothetical protein
MRRGASTTVLAMAPEAASLARKVQVMRAAVERARDRRAQHAAELGAPDPNRGAA